MQIFGPFPQDHEDYPVGLAVSGGADSLCLAWLARRWRGAVVAFVVDHGLRSESALEARQTIRVLESFGVRGHLLTLTGLRCDARVQENARKQRYAALIKAASEQGCLDLLVGHHAGDQAETVIMRRGAGSGPSGMAGMAASRELAGLRILRPLLLTDPARLRVTLSAAGVAWLEDPSNRNAAFERVRIRNTMSQDSVASLREDTRGYARQRNQTEKWRASCAGRDIIFHPAGFLLLPPVLTDPGLLGDLWQMMSGKDYPPAHSDMVALVASPSAHTLHGVALISAGKLGDGWLLVREFNAVETSISAHDQSLWDGRWRVQSSWQGQARCVIEASGRTETRGRDELSALPFAVRRTLPVVRHRGVGLELTGEAKFVFQRPFSACPGSMWNL